MAEGFSDPAIALAMRDIINALAAEAIERYRPRYQIARVASIDRTNRKCWVTFTGETIEVPVSMGSMQPYAVGQLVRVDGLAGDRFIADVLGRPYEQFDTFASKFHAILSNAQLSQVRIAFLGSSTTAGSNATIPARRWINRVTERVQRSYPSGIEAYQSPTLPLGSIVDTLQGVQAFNGGIGGTTAANYIPSGTLAAIDTLNPQIVFHMIGANDYYNGVNPDTYKTNVMAAIAAVNGVAANPLHILVHSYRRPDAISPAFGWDVYGSKLQEISNELSDVMFISVSEYYESVNADSPDAYDLISTDNLHQTDSGHDFMANAILRELRIPEPRFPAISTVVDLFNRTAGGVGNANTGQNWTNEAGVLAVVAGSKATFTTGGNASLETGMIDQDVSAVLSNITSSTYRCGVTFRVTDAATRLYASIDPATGFVELWATNAGGTVNIAQVPASAVVNKRYHIRATAIGDTVNVFLNGKHYISWVMNSTQLISWGGGTRAGLRSGVTGPQFSNFAVRPAA